MGDTMVQIADLLLGAGAIGAAFYCYVLSRRLRKFNDLENGVGRAVALLSAQVDDLTRALSGAQEASHVSRAKLTEQVVRAEATAQKLELLVASVHDVEPARSKPQPQQQARAKSEPGRFVRRAVAEGSAR